jgi:8-oxo-dGTP diphosphatase
MPDRFAVVAAVHLLLIEDGKVLLARRANTGYEDGRWSVPAGHLDGGETVRGAALREAVEEIGVLLYPDDMVVEHVMHRWRDGEERIDFFVRCERWLGEVHIAEPDKCSELAWRDPSDLPPDLIPYVRDGITRTIAGERYSEHGWQ